MWLLLLVLADVTGTTDHRKLEQADRIFMESYALYAQGRLEEALKGFHSCYDLCPRQPVGAIAAYNASFLCSRLCRIDESLAWLEKAFKAGYDNFDHVAEDGDLGNTRSDARYVEIYERARKAFRGTRPPVRHLAPIVARLAEAARTDDRIGRLALCSRLGWFSHKPTVDALNDRLQAEGFRIVNSGGWTIEPTGR